MADWIRRKGGAFRSFRIQFAAPRDKQSVADLTGVKRSISSGLTGCSESGSFCSWTLQRNLALDQECFQQNFQGIRTSSSGCRLSFFLFFFVFELSGNFCAADLMKAIKRCDSQQGAKAYERAVERHSARGAFGYEAVTGVAQLSRSRLSRWQGGKRNGLKNAEHFKVQRRFRSLTISENLKDTHGESQVGDVN